MILEDLTEQIISCAIDVHKELGPGLLESNYQAALTIELGFASLSFVREPIIPVVYRGIEIGQHRPDFIVESAVVLEIKSVARYDPVFAAQVLTYLRITGARVGLLLNFNRPVLKDGIKRCRFVNFSFSVSLCLRGPYVTTLLLATCADRRFPTASAPRRASTTIGTGTPCFAGSAHGGALQRFDLDALALLEIDQQRRSRRRRDVVHVLLERLEAVGGDRHALGLGDRGDFARARRRTSRARAGLPRCSRSAAAPRR